MNNRNEHELDKLFRKKLKSLDLGSQEHLWQGIADQISQNKRSNRFIGFGWFSAILLSFTLFGLGLNLAYKYKTEQDLNKGNKMVSISENYTNIESSENYIEKNSVEALKGTKATEAAYPKASNNIEINSNIKSIDYKDNNSRGVTESYLNRGNILNSNVKAQNSYNRKFSNENGKNDEFSNTRSKDIIQQKDINNLAGIENNENYKIDIPSQKLDLSYPEFEDLEKKELTVIKQNNLRIKSNLHLELNDYCLSKNFTPLDHFDIDVYYSPEISHRNIIAKRESVVNYAQKRSGAESFAGASSFGIRASYVTKNGLAFRTGINFGSISEKFEYFDGKETLTKVIYDSKGNPIDTQKTIIDKIARQKNVYKFYDIPALIGYEMDISDFVFSFNAGLGMNLRTKYYGSIYSEDGSKVINLNSTQGENGDSRLFKSNIGLSIVASFGLNYKLNGHFLLLAEPNLRYYLNPITTDTYSLEQRYFQMGISIGLRYRIY
ncbi:MAG: hypothetical protein IT267_10435 [Saprospiraceae bacterium]|nr:hypothetical protein [Saprospiraceae bacterium]